MSELPQESKPQNHGPLKSFLEHAEDLRWVLIKILLAIGIAWIVCSCFVPQILVFLQYPLKWSGIDHPATFLHVFTPVAVFSIWFQLALYTGLLFSTPFVIYILGSYILPALTKKERQYLTPVFWMGSLFFMAGAFFCYFVVLPPSLRIAMKCAAWLHIEVNFWTMDSYINFVTKFMLGMGIAFELPLVVLLLVYFGVLDYTKLSRARPYVIVLNFILGAVLTTPEIFTQLIMAIPLTIMYEICIWIAWFMERKKRKTKALSLISPTEKLH